MIKLLTTYLVALSISTSIVEVQAQEGEKPPEPCINDEITEIVCSRTIKQSSNKPKSGTSMELTYWVSLEN